MARHPANKAKAPFVKPSIRTGGTLAKLLAVVQLERVLLRGGDASPPDFQSFERKYGGHGRGAGDLRGRAVVAGLNASHYFADRQSQAQRASFNNAVTLSKLDFDKLASTQGFCTGGATRIWSWRSSAT